MLLSDSALMRSGNNSAAEGKEQQEINLSLLTGVLLPAAHQGGVKPTKGDENWTVSLWSFVIEGHWIQYRFSDLTHVQLQSSQDRKPIFWSISHTSWYI